MNLDELKQKVSDGQKLKYVFFWKHTSENGEVGPWCFSQWFLSLFQVAGVQYTTAEHYMMAEKAALFDDKEMQARIIAASHPGAAKKLGRKVRGYNEDVWKENRFRLVVEGNVAKFGQEPESLLRQ